MRFGYLYVEIRRERGEASYLIEVCCQRQEERESHEAEWSARGFLSSFVGWLVGFLMLKQSRFLC